MAKVTLDMDTFKALASDTRLGILKTLDGKKMSLKDISKVTKLNKATLHEHLVKLNEAGLVKKKEREGHKFVSYKLTWKGESLLHPENTRIVVMFATTFFILTIGIAQMVWYLKGRVNSIGYSVLSKGNELFGNDNGLFAEESVYLSRFSSVHGESIPQYIPDFLKNYFYDKGYYLSTPPSVPYSDKYYALAVSSDGLGSVNEEGGQIITYGSRDIINSFYQEPMFLYIAIACFVVFIIVLCFSFWRLKKNETLRL